MALLFALILIVPLAAPAERLAGKTEAEAEFDWRKLAAVGVVGSHVLSSHYAGAEQPERAGRSHPDEESDRDRRLAAEARLVESLKEHGAGGANARVIKKLIADARRNMKRDKAFFNDGLLGGFKANGLKPLEWPLEDLEEEAEEEAEEEPESSWLSRIWSSLVPAPVTPEPFDWNAERGSVPIEPGVEYYEAVVGSGSGTTAAAIDIDEESGDGEGEEGDRVGLVPYDQETASAAMAPHRVAVVKRYAVDEPRTMEDVEALQNVLRGLKKTGFQGGPFLRLFARTHRAGNVNKKSEVMVMIEPFSATLRQYLDHHRVGLVKRLSMFFTLLVGVEDLYRKAIPHNSIISPDNVLITGDLKDFRTGAVLCPSIFSTDLKVCTTSKGRFWKRIFNFGGVSTARPAEELLKADIQELGHLLEWLIRTCPEYENDHYRPFLALAQGMKTGDYSTISGDEGVAWDLTISAMAKAMTTAYELEYSKLTGGKPPKAKDHRALGLTHASPADAFSDFSMLWVLYKDAEDQNLVTREFLFEIYKGIVHGRRQAQREAGHPETTWEEAGIY